MTNADQLSVALRTEDDEVAVVQVDGEVDLASIGKLEAMLTDLQAEGKTRLVIDLSGVSFIDSIGLEALVLAHQRSADHNGDLRLAAPQAIVARVLELTALDQVLHIDSTLEAAVKAARPPPPPDPS